MYSASVENDVLGSQVVTLAVVATFKMRGAGVGGTAVGGAAVGLGGVAVGGADVGGTAVGAVVVGAGVAAGPHAAVSMTTRISAYNNLGFISSSLPLPRVC